jgi:hypothetical protein
MPAKAIALLFGTLACWSAQALACSSVDQKSMVYRKAVKKVQALPEFKAWQQYIEAHPPARIALDIQPAVQQVRIEGECYTPVTLYSDEETHFHRWNTFFVGSRTNKVLIENAEGDRECQFFCVRGLGDFSTAPLAAPCAGHERAARW